MTDHILCFDLGTTGAKTTLFSTTGEIVASTFSRYETVYPQPGWAEQSAEDWWRAAASSARALLADRQVSVAAVGLCGHMMGCLPVDGAGVPLGNSLIHSDTRSEAQCARLGGELGARGLYEITGNVLDPHYPLSKILWLREVLPEVYRKTRYILQSKDYLAFRLTGRLGITDHSDASLSACYDLHRRRWSERIAEALRIGHLLPEIVPSATVIGRVSAEAAGATGLPEGTAVVIGGGDGSCATVGAGAVNVGDAYNYIGGTSWVSAVRREPLLDGQMRLFNVCDLDPLKVNALGTVQCAGSSLEWFADQIAVAETRQAQVEGQSRYEIIGRLASQSPPGARGLVFLPYLMGERATIWDPLARGAYFGLSLAHTRADLARATLEGVGYTLRSILRVVEEQGEPVAQIRAIGGGAEGAVWTEILAGIYDRPVAVCESPSEATSRGAFVAAAIAIGLIDDWADAGSLVRVQRRHEPDRAAAEVYRGYWAFAESLYPDFRAAYRRLAQLTQGETA